MPNKTTLKYSDLNNHFNSSPRVNKSLLNYKNYNINKLLNKRSFTIKDISSTVSYRVLNHWVKEGLIEGTNKGKWKIFSLAEAIWIRLIIELRLFGFPYKKIRKTKECFFNENNKADRIIPMMKLCIIESLLKRPSYIII